MASIKFAETITVQCMGRFLCKKSAKLYHRTQSHMDRNPPDSLRLRLKHCGSDREPSKKKRDLSIEVSLESFYLCKTQVFSFRARWQGNEPWSVLLVRGGEMIPNQKSGHFSHETCTPNHRFGQGFKERVIRSQQRHVRKRQVLLDYFSYNAGSYCPSAFSDRKSQSFFDSDRCDQADCHCDVVSRHAHLSSFR